MHKTNVKTFLLTALISLSIIASGCGSGKNIPTKSIAISGSSAFAPFIKAQAEEFMKTHNNEYKIEVNVSNSQSALEQLSAGTLDIAMSDCFAYEKISPENAKGLNDNIICVQGYSIIANPGVTVASLSVNNAIGVFTGKANNWKYVGGENLPITVFSREVGSGTKTVFKKYALNGMNESEIRVKPLSSSSEVKDTVAANSGSIGYVALSILQNDNSVKKLALDNIEANAENIKSGKYPLWSYEHLYTKAQTKDYITTFINYLKAPQQKAKLVEMGYIPQDEMTVTR